MNNDETVRMMDRKLWNLYLHVAHTMMRAREAELCNAEITSRQANLLQVIARHNGTATPSEVARINSREPASISGMLGRLEKQGLIKRIRDTVRGNRVRVAITAAGEQALESVSARRSIYRIMSNLDAKEKETLGILLGKLRAGINQELADQYRDTRLNTGTEASLE